MVTTNFNINMQSSSETPTRFALIIGAMKSGTTSLFEILGQHPQICSSRLKEPDYFADDQEIKSCKNYIGLWDWKDDSHVIALESSVAYTKAPFISGVPERIFKSGLGEFRFIYMLRNPLSRIESQVRHGLFAGWGKSLDEGISEDLINFSRYAMQIDNYLKYFSKDDMILITLEEFKLNPQAVMTGICDFLGVDEKFKFSKLEEPRNSGEFFNTSSGVSRITQSRIGQFLAHKILSQKSKNWLRHIIARRSKEREAKSNMGRWQLNSEERAFIWDQLADNLRRLESDFGIDIQDYWHVPPHILDRSE